MWSYIKKAINSNLSVPLNAILGTSADTASNATLFGRTNRKLSPDQAKFYNGTPTGNTYYTVANISNVNGGECGRITCSIGGGVASTINIRITIDNGTPKILTGVINGTGAPNEMIAQSAGIFASGGYYPNLNFFQKINFSSTLKIEISTSVSTPISGAADYALYL